MTDANELRAHLAHYIGTDQWYRHAFNKTCTYTDGVKAFAQNAGGGAYWLLDILMTEPLVLKSMRSLHFIAIWLNVTEDGKADLTVRRDIGDPILFSRAIDRTDCPAGEWRFYFVDNVLMIPSEY